MRYCKLIPSKSNLFVREQFDKAVSSDFSRSFLSFQIYMKQKNLLHHHTNLHFSLHNFVLKYIIVSTANFETRIGGAYFKY